MFQLLWHDILLFQYFTCSLVTNLDFPAQVYGSSSSTIRLVWRLSCSSSTNACSCSCPYTCTEQLCTGSGNILLLVPFPFLHISVIFIYQFILNILFLLFSFPHKVCSATPSLHTILYAYCGAAKFLVSQIKLAEVLPCTNSCILLLFGILLRHCFPAVPRQNTIWRTFQAEYCSLDL